MTQIRKLGSVVTTQPSMRINSGQPWTFWYAYSRVQRRPNMHIPANRHSGSGDGSNCWI